MHLSVYPSCDSFLGRAVRSWRSLGRRRAYSRFLTYYKGVNHHLWKIYVNRFSQGAQASWFIRYCSSRRLHRLAETPLHKEDANTSCTRSEGYLWCETCELGPQCLTVMPLVTVYRCTHRYPTRCPWPSSRESTSGHSVRGQSNTGCILM